MSTTQTQWFRRAIDTPEFTIIGPAEVDELSPVAELSTAIHDAARKLDDATRASTLASFNAFLDGSRPEPDAEGCRALVHLVERSMDHIAQPAPEPAYCM